MTKEEKPDRDWKEYNEHLVQRGEILLDVESLQGWQEELFEMNLGKNGRPFRYPHSLILFLGTLRVVFGLPYRQLEGFARRLGKRISIPTPDYSTLSLRLQKLELDPDLGYKPQVEEEVVIAVESTGIKVTHRGEWMRKRRKGSIKIHVGGDTKTKQVVSLEVTDDRTDEGEKLMPLVKRAKRKAIIKRVLGDGGYATHENFRFLAGEGIEPRIKVREDSNPNCDGGERRGGTSFSERSSRVEEAGRLWAEMDGREILFRI